MAETVTGVIAVRNAAYNENGGITCDVQFDGAVNESGEPLWLPYSATETDSTPHGKALWSGLISGKYGVVTPFTVTDEVLDGAREAKRAEINRWRDIQEDTEYVMEFNGRRWDYGKKTLSRISTTRLMAESNNLPEGFAWTDGDNNVVPVTAAEIIALTELKAIRSYVVGWPAS